MAEGRITFAAQPTPTYDDFESVTITAGISQVGGRGNSMLTADVSVERARTFAAEILRSCEIVEAERKPERRLYHVWSGDHATDELRNPYNDGHPLGVHHGCVMATSLQEAADKVFDRSDRVMGPLVDPNYNRERMTYYGEPIFEREPWYA